MITINHYTGEWQAALQPTPQKPRKGTLVRIHDNPDAREANDFLRLIPEGMDGLQWVRRQPRLGMDIYRISK